MKFLPLSIYYDNHSMKLNLRILWFVFPLKSRKRRNRIYFQIDFGQILNRWFKNYLKRTDQYPSLSNRLLYRYQIETNKCSITLGKRSSFLNNDHHHTNSLQKMVKKKTFSFFFLRNQSFL